jgi:hypothetical protein
MHTRAQTSHGIRSRVVPTTTSDASDNVPILESETVQPIAVDDEKACASSYSHLGEDVSHVMQRRSQGSQRPKFVSLNAYSRPQSARPPTLLDVPSRQTTKTSLKEQLKERPKSSAGEAIRSSAHHQVTEITQTSMASCSTTKLQSGAHQTKRMQEKQKFLLPVQVTYVKKSGAHEFPLMVDSRKSLSQLMEHLRACLQEHGEKGYRRYEWTLHYRTEESSSPLKEELKW